MKKSLVVALGCLVSCAARADMSVEITVARVGQPVLTQSYAMNEVAYFDEAGITAELIATEQNGAVVIAAKCSRVTEDGQTLCGEVPCLELPFEEVVTLVATEQVRVTIVAHTTESKTAACSTSTCEQDVSEMTAKTAEQDNTTEVAAPETV